jgi:hypothetical protein
MGLNLGHISGEFQRFAAMLETTPGTYVPPITTDFLKLIDSTIDHTIPQDERDDALEGLDPYETITGKREIAVSLNRYLTPSGSLGVAPAESVLLRALLGLAPTGIGGGVSVVYGLGTLNEAVSLCRQYNSFAPIFQEQVAGFVIEEGKLTVQGADKPKWSFSGHAFTHVAVGKTAVSGNFGPATAVPVTAGTGHGFDIGGRFQVAAQTNGGVGYTASTAKAANTITSNVAITATLNDIVRPFCPTPTHVGAVIGHTAGAFSIDAVSWPLIALELDIKRNLVLVNDEYGATGMTDAILGRRMITGKMTIRAREDFLLEVSRLKEFAQRALILTMGGTAGRIAELSLPQILPDAKGIVVGQSGPGTFDVPFRALASADGSANALALTYK